MGFTYAKLPGGVLPRFIDPSALERSTRRYKSAQTSLIRHFCSTCGCHIGGINESTGIWQVSPGIFAQREGNFVIIEHIFTKSAPAGLHEWLPKIGPRSVRVWNPDGNIAEPRMPQPEKDENGKDWLRAECACGGVSFTIPRPTPEVFQDEYNRGLVSPVDPTKWKAMTDACNDCRQNTGFQLNAWVYVPLKLIKPRIGLDLTHGFMQTYSSTPGNIRSFCRVCGATVLFWGEERHTTDDNYVVNISTGILRAPDGVRADSWLTWRTEELGWFDAGCKYDRELYVSLNEGHRDWGRRVYGSLTDFKLPSPHYSSAQ
ncbi:hypothetical protein JX265_005888 [Neoarthrinium moseri]|uniref:CENP-V/GFA domain-containing protein n=1 Tax=Neoarthrinium moseri TaxID=1658444 RepID=A0A9Q0AMM2_9PEZI|nr:hypothetical protein JX265_005888 [Neoarthrinium moseri]